MALVGGKTPEQVEANIRYVDDLDATDLAEIDAILQAAPEISCASRGFAACLDCWSLLGWCSCSCWPCW